MATFSTMPAYTGLGASSTLIVGLVKAIREMHNKSIGPIEIGTRSLPYRKRSPRFSRRFSGSIHCCPWRNTNIKY